MCAVPDGECLSGRARTQATGIWLLGTYFILSLVRPSAASPQTQHPHPHLLLHHRHRLACCHLPFMMHGLLLTCHLLAIHPEVHVPVCAAQGETIHLLGISWQWGRGGILKPSSTHLMFYLSLHGLCAHQRTTQSTLSCFSVSESAWV